MAKVLVIGSGAREHTIAQTFKRSPQVDEIFVVPGNDGMKSAGISPVTIDTSDFPALIKFAKEHQVDLTFVGNEAPLVAGIVDAFEAAGLAIFGPNRQAAKLEGSKAFMKKLLADADIPTAKAETVTSLSAAEKVAEELGYPIVIKTDSLAAGKGVSIHQNQTAANEFLTKLYQKQPKAKLVIEEYLEGFEFSVFSLVGKDQVIHTPIAHDYKRRFEADRGPNTGGMGSYSPVANVSKENVKLAIDRLVLPTLASMKQQNTPFHGVLYTGVMLTKSGPKVIEFNVRFGDPETQVVLPQLQSDFYTLIIDLLAVKQTNPKWQQTDTYLGVVLVNPNYPAANQKIYEIPSLNKDILVNYASAKLQGNQLVSDGGRILTTVVHAPMLEFAREKIYTILDNTKMNLEYRQDIGKLNNN
ncbi:phosphoribosylamine--glycine ligase [Fructilactobacillus lindneri]|uniref:Phosphoribosylamine--glycine ligase n=2 Tax=Fructilactobacillus lindneri TaxID=53444 RepID=A0A0R2JWX2_9LACO|nr:phosphoribosylamine--glycine ligase [Fructilactobacillus lindneri]ANZ57908.1 phosphoribosylamine--glycine ligase [Fructilactobacillus lindneri]ANZ59178.1 phosphoribosylamine--glycine ligase [Fructilactobacillus lindneri]KRN78621.1 phosphoribosylamine--glycine ligase [Fructilactobacillus lindneri DSM 20690 = JCM 11027]POG98228.1 phosphoribosylamine--glycine ligase [Fructilactobacillus lindneri]POH01655.1 phosphoribosylamine--glycine ligase [Fructilactobacillus lindneri]